MLRNFGGTPIFPSNPQWSFLFMLVPPLVIDGFNGIIHEVVCITVKLVLDGFPSPPVTLHDSEGALDFSSDGDVVTLCCRGLRVT